MTDPSHINRPPSGEPLAWTSPVPRGRWAGFRTAHRGVEAFLSQEAFEAAQVSELENSLEDHERAALGRLLTHGVKLEIDVFLKTHGANPVFDPGAELDMPVGIAHADRVDLAEPPSRAAQEAILSGEVVHLLFQAGEATRFNEGPFYKLSPKQIAESAGVAGAELAAVRRAAAALPPPVAAFLAEGELGPKQPFFIRAALRRVVQHEVNAGRLTPREAEGRYRQAIADQKLLFFVNPRSGVTDAHDDNVRRTHAFFGFQPRHLITIEQQLVHGLAVDENGRVSLRMEEWASDAAGHLYALLQLARPEDFTTYTDSGRIIKAPELDGLAYLSQLGGRYLNVIRINDMDRHTTEAINAKAVSHALRLFAQGYVNAVEGVANPAGQKGGTGTTFGNPDLHVLTETHENSFPALSRAFDVALKIYIAANAGRHPAYNAMRQIADLAATRRVLREVGGRMVFVPRQKAIDGASVSYVGTDMPMGDLSLLGEAYKSRMFQFAGSGGKDLLIHDVKTKDHLSLALATILRQLSDPHVVAATRELILGESVPFAEHLPDGHPYGAPAPEFD